MSRSLKPTRPDPIETLTDQVCLSELTNTVEELAKFGTRDAYGSETTRVQTYLDSRFRSLQRDGKHYSQSRDFSIKTRPGLPDPPPQKNIFFGPSLDALKYRRRSLILVCAHYDSRCKACEPEDENRFPLAPGANDNATGVAALLELARLYVTQDRTQADVLFAAFGAEEYGLSGSTEAVRVARYEGWPINLVVNLDMIGNNPKDQGNRVKIGFENFFYSRPNTLVSRACAHLFARTTEAYTDLVPWLDDFPLNSDHVPFWRNDYAAIKIEEADHDTETNHTSQDVPSTVDYRYLRSVTRAALAFILTLATVRP